jgi:hypothetical protein
VIRADLLALTPEALAALSNLGLVKRATRELADGRGAALVCEADGTVVGTFPDGVVVRLAPGRSFVDGPCTCGAVGACRHRVGVVLAYLRGQSEAAPVAAPPWSPGALTDARLALALGERRLERARQSLRRPVLITLEHGAPPTARLPACTVRFLVPDDVAYARCDCAEPGTCEHLALAVWAFRLRDMDGVVTLGRAPAETVSPHTLRPPVDALLSHVLAEGTTHAAPGSACFAFARAALEGAGARWLVGGVDDLEASLEAFQRRSALFTAVDLRGLLVELEARLRAAWRPVELPAAYLLGEGEAAEVLLDHTRLVSLGARVEADGPAKQARVYLADPGTATVVVLERRWADTPDDGPALAFRRIGTRLTLGPLAHGQVVSRAVKRRANRSVELGTTRPGQTSVTSRYGDFGALPAPLLVRDLRALEARRATRPPPFLRPRVLAEDVHVVAISEVRSLAYRPSAQQLLAECVDAAGNGFLASVTHRTVAPNAVDAARAALAEPVGFLCGELRWTHEGPSLDLLGIGGAQFVVPDLAAVPVGPALVALPRALPPVPGDPVREVLRRAEGLLDELLVAGLRHAAPGFATRLAAAQDEAGLVGLTDFATRLAGLASALARREPEAACRAWLEAALFAALLETAAD